MDLDFFIRYVYPDWIKQEEYHDLPNTKETKDNWCHIRHVVPDDTPAYIIAACYGTYNNGWSCPTHYDHINDTSPHTR